MAKGKRQEAMAQDELENETMQDETETQSGNGFDARADDKDESPEGSRIWQNMMQPRDGATFGDRWAHLRNAYLGNFEIYRPVVNMPVGADGVPEITLRGNDCVSYVLGEIPSIEQVGKPVSYFDAIAKASKRKPHNNRRNFGDELFDKVVQTYIDNFEPLPQDATRTEKREHWEKVAEGFRDTPAEDCEALDKFLIRAADELRESEDLRRKPKTREKKETVAKPEKAKPVIDRAAMLQRLAQVQ